MQKRFEVAHARVVGWQGGRRQTGRTARPRRGRACESRPRCARPSASTSRSPTARAACRPAACRNCRSSTAGPQGRARSQSSAAARCVGRVPRIGAGTRACSRRRCIRWRSGSAGGPEAQSRADTPRRRPRSAAARGRAQRRGRWPSRALGRTPCLPRRHLRRCARPAPRRAATWPPFACPVCADRAMRARSLHTLRRPQRARSVRARPAAAFR